MVHSASNLVYRLVTGPIDVAPLRVLRSHSILWHGWTVAFLVLGASHAVCFERDGRRLAECLTCAPGSHFPGSALEQALCDGQRASATLSGMECSARLRVIPSVTPPFPAGAAGGGETIGVGFAGSPGGARTEVAWRADADCLAVETLHTYPGEERAVLTETLFRPVETA